MTKTNRPPAPEEIDGEALLEWERVCNELESLNQLQATDRAILVLYVETWQTWRRATAGVNKHGAVIRYPNKTVGPSPFYNVAKDCAKQLRGLLADLGLNPAVRLSNAGTNPADEPEPDFTA
ncbi:MAG TPA: phage terminase small subunit P27 family [Tepidisphaeraceae bacterium]|jgi:P27 family predicted phage terminase small subunit|nr:phage terminase small subunit P27 family [Tepidisphaeraceae bacterium]